MLLILCFGEKPELHDKNIEIQSIRVTKEIVIAHFVVSVQMYRG